MLDKIQDLQNKLKMKRERVLRRYEFYEMKNGMTDFGISTPPEMRYWKAVLGWCGKAVDNLADRLILTGFENDTSDFGGIYEANNPDIIFDSAITSALIGSCSFIYITKSESGEILMQVLDGANATGTIDETTGFLKEGYAVLKRDTKGKPLISAYFEPGIISYLLYDKSEVQIARPDISHCLLVPVIHRPDAVRPFGHSRISRACMSIMGEALRTVKRSEIAAEFFSFPQKYALNLDENIQLDKWKAAMSSMLTITGSTEGSNPQVGQFQSQSMAPHTEHLKMFASLFAGETGLSLPELGFPDSNPASADAIQSMREPLILAARKAQRCFGRGFVNAGIVAASLRDGEDYSRAAFAQTRPKWMPIFEPNLSTLGDGIIKLNQAVPGYFGRANLPAITGLDPEEIPSINLESLLGFSGEESE
jgi:hypothetical protein